MKRKRLIDQIYNGAFENATLSNKSKRALFGAGGILLSGLLISLMIRKNGGL